MIYAGLEVHIIPDQRQTCIRRTWKERLFSWPWRPWRNTKTVIIANRVLDGQIFSIENRVYMNPRTYRNFKDAIE